MDSLFSLERNESDLDCNGKECYSCDKLFLLSQTYFSVTVYLNVQ